jgi:2-polyprenyl-3-methyl-5-hydroxy-6-metoxy-1,4-benzoquinol methylase
LPSLTVCPICKTTKNSLLKKVNNFLIYKCKNCSLSWVPNEINNINLESFYDETYYKNTSNMGYGDYINDEKNHRLNAKNIIKILKRFRSLKELDVLDIGCAHGFFIDELQKISNCNATGIEISSCAYDYAKNKLNLKVINEEFNGNNFGETLFDVVFLLGTIEHLQFPDQMLENIKKVLKPDGLLIITTIDTSGILPLYHLKPPEHLFYFNQKNLTKLAENFGYTKIYGKMHFVSYFLYDLLARLNNFFSLPFLGKLSEFTHKFFPDLNFVIPTNEMLIIFKNNKSHKIDSMEDLALSSKNSP